MWLPREFERMNIEVRRTPRMEEALEEADVVLMLRVQQERPA